MRDERPHNGSLADCMDSVRLTSSRMKVCERVGEKSCEPYPKPLRTHGIQSVKRWTEAEKQRNVQLCRRIYDVPICVSVRWIRSAMVPSCTTEVGRRASYHL